MSEHMRDFSLLRQEINSTAGSRNPRAKLNEQRVADIRREHAEGGKTLAELAKAYRVHVSTIHRVVSRAGWSA